MPETAPPEVRHITLDALEEFMRADSSGPGWVLLEKRKGFLRFEKTVPAQNGSCLLAGILFLLGLIPGILYLAFARHAARTIRLTVTTQPDGTLSPSGDNEGLRLFDGFVNPEAVRRTSRRTLVITLVVIIAVLLLVWIGSLKK